MRVRIRPLGMVTPQRSPSAAFPDQALDQVIAWASRLVRVAELAPSMVAIAAPEPPEVAAIDNVALVAEFGHC